MPDAETEAKIDFGGNQAVNQRRLKSGYPVPEHQILAKATLRNRRTNGKYDSVY